MQHTCIDKFDIFFHILKCDVRQRPRRVIIIVFFPCKNVIIDSKYSFGVFFEIVNRDVRTKYILLINNQLESF